MTPSDKIDIGDVVTVCFVDESRVTGEVLYLPQATGDCWHIKAKNGLFYVQSFQHIWKEQPNE